ncbi:MAG: YncE family protein [candidate division WOR-3 bacterium]|nr:MAG: YncE family protein [candidate division WOR-3 bacterium]
MLSRLSLVALCISAAGGQTLDTVVHFPREVDELFYVPGGNKLYVTAYVRDTWTDHIHILDCSTMVVRAVVRTGSRFGDRRAAWSPHHNKVYLGVHWGGPDTAGLLVIDNSTDSVVRRLPVGVYMRGIAYSSTSDKLYTVTGQGGIITALDCAADTVLAVIKPPDYSPDWVALWDSVGMKIYVGCSGWTNCDRVTVVDCITDSVVAVIRSGIVCPCIGVYNPFRRKIYLGAQGDYGVCAVDCAGDTVAARFDSIWSDFDQVPAYCSAGDKLYWFDYRGPIYVIDCGTDSIVRHIPAPGGNDVSYIAYAEWSNRLYVASHIPRYANLLTVFDCRTDSIIGQTRFGRNASAREIVCNPVDHRIYISVRWDSAVYVFIEELQPIREQPALGRPVHAIRVWPNPARDQIWLRNPGPVPLYSACGRRVTTLLPGPNDIRHLASGVYFATPHPRPLPQGEREAAVRKIVVQR